MSWFSNKFNQFKNWIGEKKDQFNNWTQEQLSDEGSLLSQVKNAVPSVVNQVTQAGPTGQDLWTAQREDTTYQRTTADMQAAGLNPAVMLGNNGSPVSASGASGNSGGVNAFMQAMSNLALVESQRKNIDANTAKTEAETRNVELSHDEIAARIEKLYADTENVRSSTVYQNILNEIAPEMNKAQLNKLLGEFNLISKDISKTEAETIALNFQNAFEEINSKYYDDIAKYRKEYEYGRSEWYKNRALHEATLKAMDGLREMYMRDNTMEMGKADASLIVAAYIMNAFGIDHSKMKDLVGIVKDAIKKGAKEFGKLYEPGTFSE